LRQRVDWSMRGLVLRCAGQCKQSSIQRQNCRDAGSSAVVVIHHRKTASVLVGSHCYRQPYLSTLVYFLPGIGVLQSCRGVVSRIVTVTVTTMAMIFVHKRVVDVVDTYIITVCMYQRNPLTGTSKPQSNGPLYYINTVTGTLVVDAWVVTFGTSMRGIGGLRPRPVPPRCTKCNSPPING